MNARAVVLISAAGFGPGRPLQLTLNAKGRRGTTDQRAVTAQWAARLRGWIRRTIRLRAPQQEDLHADLEQAAYLRLVEIDPSRLTAADEDWVKKRIRYAIRRALDEELCHARPTEGRVDSDSVSADDVGEGFVPVAEAARFRRNRRRRLARRTRGPVA